MIDAIIFYALMMSLATGVGVVYLFNLLVNSDGSITIPTDRYNEAELIAATLITALVVIALVCFVVRKIRR